MAVQHSNIRKGHSDLRALRWVLTSHNCQGLHTTPRIWPSAVYIFITTPAFSSTSCNTCIHDDGDCLKGENRSLQDFSPSRLSLACLSLTHSSDPAFMSDNVEKKKKRWHFLTFKKCSLIITNCTISHILLLIRLAIKKKWKLKLSVLCSLWNTTSNVLVSVPWLPSREGEALVCSWHSAPTADRRTENIWHQIRHKVYIYYRSRFIDLWARFKN